ncbi:hypothetical protein pETSU_150 [Edwardsiella phage pEt-SU]|uniref:Uncharacterized protein n=1 Tax=Edwardsiella phage pEt-SU TaxID=2562142 RepID=A0A4D6DWK1_9CAUD|nr:hypothetical protein HOV39_gp150 [Edwardsiella phage pEt-SU]QBZ70731.1 hypothetical protein pETSU_150 [Edwardsiella phage pEt-SU]
MITVTGTNSKRVKDPVFLSAKRFMAERIAKLEALGEPAAAELALAKRRYDGLIWSDVIIEPPVGMSNGIVRACFVSRKTGFLRADISVEKVNIADIFTEFGIIPTEYIDADALVAAINGDSQGRGLVYIHSTERYGVVINAANANPDEVMSVMEDIYWDTVASEAAPQMDPVTKASGTFRVEAINIDSVTGDLFFIEDVNAIV